MNLPSPSASLSLDQYDRRSRVRHALKTALAACLATVLAYLLRIDNPVLSPLFVFLQMAMALPYLFRTWAQTVCGLLISAAVATTVLTLFDEAAPLFLALMLVWIFGLLLFANWYLLPATLGTMLAAIVTVTALVSSPAAGLAFVGQYLANWLVAGLAACTVHYLLWHGNRRRAFLHQLAAVYGRLEEDCRELALRLRAGAGPRPEDAPLDWAPFRGLRGLMAASAHPAGDPFVQMTERCQSTTVRLRFLGRNLPAAAESAGLEGLLERFADHYQRLLAGALGRTQVGPVDPALLAAVQAQASALRATDIDFLLRQGVYPLILDYLARDLAPLTALHNAIVSILTGRTAGQMPPAPAAPPRRLLDVESWQRSVKMVVILLLLLGEELLLDFPGGTQVAFFGTFFAGTGNLGRQNRTDIVGLAGLLAAVGFALLAALVTSREPRLPLALAFVFLGLFAADSFRQTFARWSAAGFQFGLGLVFAYLATPGPEWGSFAGVRTRVAGLLVAGLTATLVHTYLWPVLPVRRLRESLAAALDNVAQHVERIFRQRCTPVEPPPDLVSVATGARELLDDARFLAGPDRGDDAYQQVLPRLQEIDYHRDYVDLLLQTELDKELAERFFRALAEYPEQLRRAVETVVELLDRSFRRAARIEPIHWQPGALRRFEAQVQPAGSVPEDLALQVLRLAVVARCLDNIAEAIASMSQTLAGINRRAVGTE